MADPLYTLVICEILIPGKAPDIKYVHFKEESVYISKVDQYSIIQYLKEENNYPEGTIINIKDILVLNYEEFKKYIQLPG